MGTLLADILLVNTGDKYSEKYVNNIIHMLSATGTKYDKVHVIRDELPEWYETAVHANQGSVPAKHTMETRFAKVHASEWKWVGYDFDFVIPNSGTLEDLQTEVDSMFEEMQNRKSKLNYYLDDANVVNIYNKDK